MILLDTDVLTLLLAGHAGVTERSRRAEDEVAITIVTRVESLLGRFAALLKAADGQELLRAQDRLERHERGMAPYPVIPFAAAAVAVFDRLRAVRKVKKIGRANLLIASIALAHRATLATRNLRHFRAVPGLALDDWAA
jgi:tRNA(fMet)-specific endonuclease VapC